MNQVRISKLQAYLAEHPNDSFSLYALALEEASDGNVPKAVSMLENLIHLDPEYVAAYQQLGDFYQKLNRTEDAVEKLQKGIRTARVQGDLHASGEMQAALDELLT